MKHKKVSFFLVVVYLTIALPLVYNLISFPNEILETIGTSSPTTRNLVYSKTWTLNLYIIAELTLGLFGMLMLAQGLIKQNYILSEATNEMKEELESTKKTPLADRTTTQKPQSETTNTATLFQLEKLSHYNAEAFLSYLAKNLELSQAAWYLSKERDSKTILEFISGYAYYIPEGETITFRLGEGLPGQAAKSHRTIHLENYPSESSPIISGLGKGTPKSLIVIPFLKNDQCVAVLEMASFKTLSESEVQTIANIDIEQIPALLSPAQNV